MTWADKVRLCVEWCETDEERLAELRTWLDPECDDVVEALVEALVGLDGARPLNTSARFARRLRDVLREWLTGTVAGAFDEDRAERRVALGRELADVDLALEDVILLESVAQQRLFTLVQQRLDEEPRKLTSTMQALSKAMTVDRALIYAGCLDLHDEELEQALLDRFLSVTGFSPTLYESLAEAWRWSQERVGYEDV
jgi:hypothetical protein